MAELTASGIQTGTAEELYGLLNELEQQNAPPRLWVQGDAELLRRGLRVAVVGSPLSLAGRSSAPGSRSSSRFCRKPG